jgi:Uma2 family endonuclease
MCLVPAPKNDDAKTLRANVLRQHVAPSAVHAISLTARQLLPLRTDLPSGNDCGRVSRVMVGGGNGAILLHVRLPSTSTAEQIVAMPAQRAEGRRWTPEEFYAARDAASASLRYELVDGELLVTPSPVRRHQRIVARLWALLDPYVRRERLGELLFAPFDVRLEPSVILQPDILLIPPDDSSEREVRFVSLAVEVISPGSARHDRVTKRSRYQRNAVPEYWIVDNAAQMIEGWQPTDERPQIALDTLVWHPAGASAPWTLNVQEFFDGVGDSTDAGTSALGSDEDERA